LAGSDNSKQWQQNMRSNRNGSLTKKRAGTPHPGLKPDSEEDKLPIILIGTGPVGIRFAEELFNRGFAGNLKIFGEEPWDPYNRVKLTSVLAGDTDISDIDLGLTDINEKCIDLHLSCRIIAIDISRKTVTDSNNQVHRYQKLVIATGSKPRVSNIHGADKKGVYTFRDLQDTEALLARTSHAKEIVVAGGGLLGVETARALQRRGAKLTLVQHAPLLMNRQLDESGSPILRNKINKAGIRVLTGSGLAAVLGEQKVTGVKLQNNCLIACDTVLLATGISPNVELARKSWIQVGSGIIVDNYLHTSARDVYAIGACAEHNGQTYGFSKPGYEQAGVLAEHMMGGDSQYSGSLKLAELKLVDEPVFSMGMVVDLPRHPLIREFSWRSADNTCYRKLVLERGRLAGVMAIGQWPESGRLQVAMLHHQKIWFWNLRRFRQNGTLWSSVD